MVFKNLEELKNTDFPVVIVGSGAAGISVALKLEEKKNKIINFGSWSRRI